MRTPFGQPFASNRCLIHVTVDENDYPIVLTQHQEGSTGYFEYYIQRWTGTDWTAEIQIASSIINDCREGFLRIYDFDYNPTTGDYILMEDAGFTGIFALDEDTLEVMFREDNVFGLTTQVNFRSGVFIDKDSPECRIFIISGTWEANQDSYCARYDHLYGGKETSVLVCSETPYTTPLHGTGSIVANNEDPPTYYYMGEGWSDDYNYRPISKVEIPGW